MPTRKGFYLTVAKSLISPWRCGVVKPSTRLRWSLQFRHEEAKSESLLLGRSDAIDSAMMMPTRKGFYSVAGKSSISPSWCEVIKNSTRMRRSLRFCHKDEKLESLLLGLYLQLGHDDASSERLLVGRNKVFDSVMTMQSRKTFYLAAAKFRITLWWRGTGRPSTLPQWRLRFGHDGANS